MEDLTLIFYQVSNPEEELKMIKKMYAACARMGKSCHIWQFLKVLWTHFCVDRTADLSSFMLRKLLDLGSFMYTFPTQ